MTLSVAATAKTGVRLSWPRLYCVALAVFLASACAQTERSTEAFCSTYNTQTQALADKYSIRMDGLDATADPLSGLLVGAASLIEAQGDMVVLFDKLSAVAPDEIRSETELLRDLMQSNADAMASGDLGRMFTAGVISSFQANGAAETVDTFIAVNCTGPGQ